MKKTRLKSRKKDIHNSLNDDLDTLVTSQEQKFQSFSTPTDQTKKNFNQTQFCELDFDEQEEMILNSSAEGLKKNNADTISTYVNGLIAKNKVNAKNAFEVPLIQLQQTNYYNQMAGDNSWRKISSSLESNNKIYGYRVDATHNYTIKVLNLISHSDKTNDEEVNQTSSKKRYAQNTLNTQFFAQNQDDAYTQCIEKNKSNINIQHLQTFFSVNPIMERTKRAFDQQGMKALLLDNIGIENNLDLRIVSTFGNKIIQKQQKQQMIQDENTEAPIISENIWIDTFDKITQLCTFCGFIEPSQIKKQDDFDEFESMWKQYQEITNSKSVKVQDEKKKKKQNQQIKIQNQLNNFVEISSQNEQICQNAEPIHIQDNIMEAIAEEKQGNNDNQIQQKVDKQEDKDKEPLFLQNQHPLPELETNIQSKQQNQTEYIPLQSQRIPRQVPIISEIKFKSIKFPPEKPELHEIQIDKDEKIDKQTAYEKWTNPKTKQKRTPSKIIKQAQQLQINFSLSNNKRKFSPRKMKYDTLLVDKKKKKQMKILLKSVQQFFRQSNCVSNLSLFKSDFLANTHLYCQTQELISAFQSQYVQEQKNENYIDLTRNIPNITQGETNYIKTNIKVVKQKLYKYIFQDNLDLFEDVYEQYLIEEGQISPALCFLTILHLANEHHLTLVENSENNLQIITPEK